MSTTPQTPAPRRRHLIDPANPPRRTAASDRSLSMVQKWVLSALAVTTILHLSAGLLVAAYFLDETKVQSRIGLVVIAGLVGMGAVAAARLIHQKSAISLWLALGLAPMVVGLALVL